MSYTRVNWQNAPSTATPVNAENLNIMDKGIADAHSQLADKANQSDLDTTNANVALKSDIAYVDTQDSLKRDKSVKLEMEDMSDAVISAITGGATVNVLSVPQDNSVTSIKLHDEVLSRVPYLSSADSANNAINVGAYLCINALDMPEASGTFVLTVDKAKTVAGNSQYWVVQTATKDSSNSKQYKRFGYYNSSTLTWKAWTECLDPNSTLTVSNFVDNSITRSKLHNDYMINYSYVPADGDINNALTQGNYIVLPGASNSPLTNKTFTLSVDVFKTSSGSSYWLTQVATTADGTPRSFIRKLYQGQSFSSWVELTNNESTFEGKNIVCFGDSITANGDYPARLATKTGATVTSLGFGGCRMTTYGDTSDYTNFCMANLSQLINAGDYSSLDQPALNIYNQSGVDYRPQVARLKALDFNTVDYIIIFFGTNDYGGNIPIGNDADTTRDTFKGAINLVVQNILSKHPHIKIMFVSPFWRATYTGVAETVDSDTYANPLGNLLIHYVDALIARAHAHHIPVLDLYRESGINKYNYAYYLADGLHPKTEIGYEHVAQKITAGFKSKFSA